MTEHVRRHPLFCQRGACALSYGDVFGKRMLHGVSAEPPTSATREEKARFVTPCSLIHAFSTATVGLANGVQRSLRPLPSQRTCAPKRFWSLWREVRPRLSRGTSSAKAVPSSRARRMAVATGSNTLRTIAQSRRRAALVAGSSTGAAKQSCNVSGSSDSSQLLKG